MLAARRCCSPRLLPVFPASASRCRAAASPGPAALAGPRSLWSLRVAGRPAVCRQARRCSCSSSRPSSAGSAAAGACATRARWFGAVGVCAAAAALCRVFTSGRNNPVHAEAAKPAPSRGSEQGVRVKSLLSGTERAGRDAKATPDDGSAPMRARMAAFVKELQAEIVRSLEEVENEGCLERGETETRFLVDEWKRPEGGDGVSCVLQDGKVFQKAGVLVSVVYGTLPEAAVKQMRSERSKDLKGDGPFPFFAAGISLVVHPRNPFAPTVHLNYRYFEIEDEETGEATLWWFGGGTDLTPAYLFEEDAEHFHATIKRACDANSPRYYPEFKEWCDRYFYLPHRKECRGVGGIFYDDQAGDGTLADRERLFALARDCGRAFVPSYVPIVRRRKDMPYTEENLRWQQLRRGRYVEFNLVQDRGTKFGLTTPGARTESILVSLPLTARWEYCHTPLAGSSEAKLVEVLQHPREWVK